MAPAATTPNLDVYKDWMLLLFRGKHETQKLTEAEIADKLRQARVDASITEVHAALQMWGEVSTTSDSAGIGLLSPPPEHEYPSASHTPLGPPSGSSPFKGDGLFAFIELYGLPKGVPMPKHIAEDIGEREQRQIRSQMMDKYLRTVDDPYTPAVASRVRQRQAALEIGPLRVGRSQCELNILDVDDGMGGDEKPATDGLYGPKDSPYFSCTKGRESDFVAKHHSRAGEPAQASSKDQRRVTSAPQLSTSAHTLQTPPTEQTQEKEKENEGEMIDEIDEGPDHYPNQTPQSALDFDTQFCQSHGSNYSSRKRVRRSSTATADDDEGSSKRLRGNVGSPSRIVS